MKIENLFRKETIAESAGIVLAFTLIQPPLQMVRGIVFARFLGPSEYGVYTLAFFFIPLAALLSKLGIPSCFTRYIPQYEKQEMLRDFIVKAYRVAFASSCLITLLCVLYSDRVAELIYESSQYSRLIVICSVCILPHALFESLKYTFNGLRIFKLSYLLTFFQFLVFTLLGITLAIAYRNAEPAIVANLIALILAVTIFGYIMMRYLIGQEEQRHKIHERGFYKKIFKYSVWFVISPIVFLLFRYTDRWMLNRFLELRDVGVYSVGENVAALIFMFGTLAGNILMPNLSTLWEQGERKRALNVLDLALRGNILMLICGAFVLVMLKDHIITLLYGAEYSNSASVIGVLLIFFLLHSVHWTISGYAGLIEKTYIPLVGSSIGLAFNVLLNFLLIPEYGIMGAAMATSISFVVILIVIFAWFIKEGLKLKLNTFIVCLLPGMFVLNEIAIIVIFVGLMATVFLTQLLVTGEERRKIFEQMRQAIFKYVRRK
ncbi:MAG: oligosaccharide flippase family protein [Candidatus Latescibacteria bacterium]|nr:oligosaccharide flippase family protein [Candidatus Latescibacterota bacterium]NIM64458.1 oligosaccharide flippase family protein [Candidatus Latescibacterota bacterium]NIO00611.1 oligosaccharide flippase family protein [Candidatus Latescibacterota bacterium]NIO27012.1 oligosaccharide flippase family protein [Candidatus Latescibacterota bacterium]NIO56089.1 oligosaccharide flippase family protein [Candidatus Latescibacterota bacterium]